MEIKIARSSRRMASRALLALASLMALLVVASPSYAILQTLTDGNSTVDIYTQAGDPRGMQNWVVDGVDHAWEQSFFVRVGAAGSETPVQNLNLALQNNLGSLLFLRYDDPNSPLRVELSYSLTGGSNGSSQSSILQLINLINRGAGPLAVSFYQYSEFDLNDTPGDDTASIVPLFGPNTARQTDPALIIEETPVTPPPTRYEVSFYASLETSLLDGAVTTLSNNAGPIGPGDVGWGFQWDVVLPANGTFQISKPNSINPVVPEPSSVLLAGLAGLALVGYGLRRKAA